MCIRDSLWNAPTKDVYSYTEDPAQWHAPDELAVSYTHLTLPTTPYV